MVSAELGIRFWRSFDYAAGKTKERQVHETLLDLKLLSVVLLCYPEE